MMPSQFPGAMPQPQYQRPAVPAQQRMPSPAHLASGAYDRLPITARGVSAAPMVPPPTRTFAVPSPQALGVSTSLSLPRPAPPSQAVNWTELQSRMQRLGVVRYQKTRVENGAYQVTMLFPTSDPTKGQPMSAQANSEAEAIVMILNHAESLASKR